MAQPLDEVHRTRATLLERLKNWEDQSSWQQFFDTYWGLIYGVARQAGLSDAEAQDVVQETMSGVAKHMPSFQYNPALGSFKTWLLNMTRWRIIDQRRKRAPVGERETSASTGGTATASLDRLVDPATLALDVMWDAEWEKNLFNAAIARVKQKIDPEKFQIFDFYVKKEWAAEKVAATFGASIDQVYLIKHRVTEMLKEEVKRLEKELT
jgi:RNA polymerase sigma-70 factor (ECF subfamily)